MFLELGVGVNLNIGDVCVTERPFEIDFGVLKVGDEEEPIGDGVNLNNRDVDFFCSSVTVGVFKLFISDSSALMVVLSTTSSSVGFSSNISRSKVPITSSNSTLYPAQQCRQLRFVFEPNHAIKASLILSRGAILRFEANLWTIGKSLTKKEKTLAPVAKGLCDLGHSKLSQKILYS